VLSPTSLLHNSIRFAPPLLCYSLANYIEIAINEHKITLSSSFTWIISTWVHDGNCVVRIRELKTKLSDRHLYNVVTSFCTVVRGTKCTWGNRPAQTRPMRTYDVMTLVTSHLLMLVVALHHVIAHVPIEPSYGRVMRLLSCRQIGDRGLWTQTEIKYVLSIGSHLGGTIGL